MIRAARAAALALALAVLGGCGGGSSHSAGSAATATTALTGDAGTIRAADCRYWNVTDAAEHANLLAAMRAFFGATADNGQRGPVLTDRQATAVLDGACRAAYARAFKLYKIYGRAAAFTSQG